MKEYFRNILKKLILDHTVKLQTTDDSLIFKFEKIGFFGKKYLLIKHRKTGKRISKQVRNSRVELHNYELKKMGEFEIFDIYLKVKIGNFEFIVRTKFESSNKGKSLINRNDKTIFIPYKTIESNLSFNLIEAVFDQEITSLKSDQNHVQIKGVLNLFEDISFDSIELMAKSEGLDEIKIFKCEYEKKENVVKFKAKIKLEIIPEYIDKTWDLFIRLKNNDIIIFKEQPLQGNNLKKFDTYEDYYLTVLDNKIRVDHEGSHSIDVVTYYLATDNYYIKFRVTTKDNWIEKIKIARNKTLYEKFVEEEDIDDKLIFFESFHGKSYSHNPKYIYEKMLDLGYNKTYKFVWSYEGKLKIPGNPIIVNRTQESYYRYLAASKFWINNVSFPINEKRKGTIYLQTTHGTPLKRMGSDIENINSKIVRGKVRSESKKWNYLISPNRYSYNIFKRAFEYKNKILNTGYPANDIFYCDDKNEKMLKIKSELGIADNKKIILYAPTFRDLESDREGNHYFNLEIDLETLYNKFKEDYIILLRLHYIISNILKIDSNLKEFVMDVSDYDDVHELCLISDVLITDYSSVFFDFAHTKKPILFFTPDFYEYESTRGLYLEKNDLPGPLLYNMNDLVNGIKNLDEIERKFKNSYDKFYKEYCNLGHGNASKKVIEVLMGE